MASKASFSYMNILRQAYQLTKRHKFLWFFGFFASFLGIGGELEPLFRNYLGVTDTTDQVFGLQSLYQDGVLYRLAQNVADFFGSYPWQAVLFLLLILAITLVLIWLAIVSQIALFDSAYKLTKGKEANYAEGYHVGNRHFGPVLLVNIILKGLLYVLIVVVGSTLVSWFLVRSSTLGGLIFIILVFLVFIPISIILSFIVRFTIAYMVIREKRAMESVRLAWNLFKKNWVTSIEMAVIIIVLGLAVGIAMLLALGLAAVPFVLIGIAALFFGSGAGFAIAVVAGTVTWLAITALIGSIFVSFQYSAWTLLFVELDEAKAHSKILRFLSNLVPGKAS